MEFPSTICFFLSIVATYLVIDRVPAVKHFLNELSLVSAGFIAFFLFMFFDIVLLIITATILR